ncbi:hypothetical protein OIU76_007894 [Salix suchowensis]|nr:hypothetical protein OIU78_011534 [Salix suchowensis]KAJ6338309.1 hypothetical protein OIU76_007894 [Salix suchowensis]
MTNLYVTAVPPADLNRNTEWFMYPGGSRRLVPNRIIFGCSPAIAWTIVNLSHFAIPGRTWSLCFVPYSEHKTFTANTLIDLVESLEWITLHEVFVELFLKDLGLQR